MSIKNIYMATQPIIN